MLIVQKQKIIHNFSGYRSLVYPYGQNLLKVHLQHPADFMHSWDSTAFSDLYEN